MSIKKKIMIIGGGIGVFAVIGLLVGGSIMLYRKASKQLLLATTQQLTPTPTIREDTEETMIHRVANHMVLPDETPRVVPIVDVQKLKKDQPFFEHAESGDVLVVFSQKVILYSPARDKIVEVALIRVTDNPLATPSSSLP